jgi:signal transduction histidine kinase
VKTINLFRSMGLQLAALTTLLVLVAMLALSASTYVLVKSSLEQSVRNSIQNEVGSIVADSQGDPTALAREVARRSSPGTGSVFDYRLVTVDKRHVAGEEWILPGPPGWAERGEESSPEQWWPNGRAITLTVPVQPDMLLTVARDVGWIDNIDHELLSLLRWLLPIGILLATVTAFLANRFMTQRLDIVANAAAGIMDGDLSRRVPVTGAGDDFDRLAHTLNAMLARIQALMDSLEQVTNDIAHDLRTPLGRLRQQLELARSEAMASGQNSASIDQAISEADAILSTFSALLRIGQIQAGAQRSAFQALNLSEIAATVVDAYGQSGEEIGHTLTSAISPGLRLSGDRDLLTQLLANLIENALAHTPKGTTIDVRLTPGKGVVEMVVADNGPGVPASEREKIFRRFYRLEQSRTTPGTGLGLSLVAAIAKLHGASICAEDNNPGLRVRISFPADVLASPVSTHLPL